LSTLLSRCLVIICLAIVHALQVSAQQETPNPAKPSVLFLRLPSGWGHGEAFFREYARDLVKQGYTVGVRDMEMTYSNSPGDFEVADIGRYDLIVFLDPPFWKSETGKLSGPFSERWQAVLKHVEAGGGLLFFPFVAGSYRYSANQMFRPLGLTFLNGVLYSDAVINATVMNINWAFTNEFTEHPATGGLSGIWYPVRNSRFVWNQNTVPFQVDSNWEVLLRGEQSARVEAVTFNEPRVDAAIPAAMNSIPSSPPLLAARSLGKGRIAVMGVPSAYHIFGGLAPGYEKSVMGIGLDGKPGDMPKLLENLFAWLSEPARKGKLFAGAVTDTNRLAPASFAAPEPFPMEHHLFPGIKKSFRGVIGARTNYSTGKSAPEEYVSAAKKAGLDFLVILEDYEHITEAKFQELQAKCETMNSDDFIVFVGLTYRDQVDNTYFAFRRGLVFPQEAWMAPGTKRFQTIYEKPSGLSLNEFAQKNGSNECFIGHYRPEKGRGVPFWDIRTYRNVLAVWTYDNGKLIDEMVDEYGVVSDAAELPRCMALTLMDDASQIDRVAAGEMPHTVLLSHSFKDLRELSGEMLSPGFEPLAYATEGPVIENWQWAGPRDYVANGNWFDWTRYLWKIRLSVKSDSGLKEIRVMDGTELFRRFLPNGATSFEQEIVLTHNQQHHLFLVVTDTNGRRAISENLIDRNHLMEFVYCSDRNNTLSYSATAAPDSPWGSTANNWCLPTQPKGPMSDNLRIDLNLDQLRFPGYDGQPGGGAIISAAPQLVAKEGSEGGSINRQIRLPMACADAVLQENVISHTFPRGISVWNSWNNLGPLEESQLYRGTVRYTTFIHPGHLPGPVLVEGQLEILKDLTFDAARQIHLLISNATASRVEGGYRMGAIQHTKDRSHAFELHYDGRPQQLRAGGALQRGGYVYFYPSLFGPFGVFSLQDDLNYFYIGDIHACQVGYNLADRPLKKGDKLTYRYLAFTGAYNDQPSLEVPETFRDIFALDGSPGYQVSTQDGKVTGQEYVLRIDGDQRGFCGSINLPRNMPAVLPVVVENLNDRWTAVYYDRKKNTSRPLGMHAGAAYAHVPPGKLQSDIFIGHPFTCDQPKVFMTVVQTGEKEWLMSLHNPTDKPLIINARRSNYFGALPMYPIQATVPAGQTVRIEMPKTG